ncbi:MAG: hypothetical protein JSV80_06435 [Acidobacteriota bacterium]|nr:MAG: hypothetical protein JSV80_06435 [Acidobacteriota bacterium]
MSRKLFALLVLGLLLASPGFAQDDTEADAEAEPTKEYRLSWGIFAGQLTGDEISKQAYEGLVPELDDTTFAGALFAVRAGRSVWAEIRLGLSQTQFLNTPKGDMDVDLWFLDVAFVPQWQWGRWGVGVPLGVGWASASTDDVLLERIPGRDRTLQLDDGDGGTYFAGVRGFVDASDRWTLSIDVRAKRFHRLINVTERNVKSTELSIAFSRKF